jgi:purine-nucleoside phosphorylase
MARARKAGEAETVEGAAAALRAHAGGDLDLCVVLGSGVAGPALEEVRAVPVGEIPGLRVPTVPGHAGQVRFGRVRGLRAAVFSGRCHLYEGYSAADVVRPVRAAARAGARLLCATNAAGGISEWLRPGDFLVIGDHLDLGGGDPSAGEPDGLFGRRFFPMAASYDDALANAAIEAGRRDRVSISRGVYAFVRGPAYETAAEVRMLRTLGADAVGMSTVPETMAARRMGMRVFALSVVSNRAGAPLDTHEKVVDHVRSRGPAMARLLDAVVASFAEEEGRA